MSENETKTEPVAPRVKQKRKYIRKAAPEPVDEFAGLTVKDCCDGCTASRCVITGSAFCGHPYKSSHPTAAPKVKERIRRAKTIIAHLRVDARAG